jgi:outer membrane protein insertion porin family
VKEKASGNLLAGIGFSQSQGIIFNTSITQNNFLGTGKRVSFAFNNSDANRLYRLAYTNPYYTIDGISRGFELAYRETDFEEFDSADYLTDVGIAEINFGLPITDTSRAGLAFRYQYTDFTAGDSALAEQFVEDNGETFNDFLLAASYTNDTRDNAIFPSRGGLQNLVAEVAIPGSDLQYYRITYRHRHFIPLTQRFTVALNADLGYGGGLGDTDALPFFEHFFAGGPRTVRGWEENTLGARETTGDQDPIGGNVKIVGGIELFAPPPIGGDFAKTLRIGAFFDFGNVWVTEDNDLIAPTGFDIGDLRYSTGLSAVWLSPVGAISVSVAYPINDEREDDTQVFQFGFGQTF